MTQTTGWLIYNKENAIVNKSFIDWFIEEAQQQELNLKLIIREDLSIGIKNNERILFHNHQQVVLPAFAVVRTIDPLLSLHLESLGIMVFNSSEISKVCNNKALTHHFVHNIQIPMVNTLYIKQDHVPSEPPLDYPFVAKETSGRGGKQVYMVNNDNDWDAVKSAVNDNLIIQSCSVQLGKDIRVFIVGKEIVGAVLRKSNGDFRANFKLGGTASWYPLKAHEIAMIKKIIHHFDFDMVGIDFLMDPNGNLLFNEIEDVVGSRTLSAVSDINILEKYVAHIKRKLKNRC